MAKRKTKDNIIELAEHQVVDGNELRDLIREKAPWIVTGKRQGFVNHLLSLDQR